MNRVLEAVLSRNVGSRVLALLAVVLGLGACSGVDITPAETETFATTNYTRYAWRSEPAPETSYGKDMLAKKSPVIRAGVEERMAELGYQLVGKPDAEFLIEYFVVPGFNDGGLPHGGDNDMLYGSSINRQIDGASADNALALSAPVETADMQLVFFDAGTNDVLWHVHISIVVEDSNRIDYDEVDQSVRKAVSALPPAR